MSPAAQPTVVLPGTLIGRSDLARLVREVESVDDDFEGQKVREHKTTGFSIPTMSRSLSDFLQLNSIDIANTQVRMELKNQLRIMKDKSPIIHMTFAAEPEPEFLQQLVTWIRQEIHPAALLTLGLQPALIGGVKMRTPNHIHDYSVRTMLSTKRVLIHNELEALIKQAESAPVVPAPPIEPASAPA
jgi:hypothetical protein